MYYSTSTVCGCVYITDAIIKGEIDHHPEVYHQYYEDKSQINA